MAEDYIHPKRYTRNEIDKQIVNKMLQSGAEVWDIERMWYGDEAHLAHLDQVALEYLLRWREKNGAADLRKLSFVAAHMANVIDQIENRKREDEAEIREAARRSQELPCELKKFLEGDSRMDHLVKQETKKDKDMTKKVTKKVAVAAKKITVKKPVAAKKTIVKKTVKPVAKNAGVKTEKGAAKAVKKTTKPVAKKQSAKPTPKKPAVKKSVKK